MFILTALVAALPAVSVAAGDLQPPPYESRGDREYERYYDEPDGPRAGIFADLEFYGRWRHVHAYGWVWQPFVEIGWRPFQYGHWVWTEFGWMWASYEPFGWATYHYGYWDYDFRLGWIWIPDYEWSPCRVQWVFYDDYVCWAPMAPRGVYFGYPWSSTRFNVWISVPVYHFTDVNVGRHRVKPPRFKSDYGAKTVYRAPERDLVERYEGRKIREMPVEFKRAEKDGRELRRVVLPREQERVVERYRRETPSQERAMYGQRNEALQRERIPQSQRLEAKQRAPESGKVTGEKQRSKAPPAEKSDKSKSSGKSKKSRGDR